LSISSDPIAYHPLLYEDHSSQAASSNTLHDFDPMSMLNVDMFASSFNPIHPEAVSHQSALSTIHQEVPASK
jgi:hypothetical protein